MEDIVEVLRYLNSADGPNIPLRTLGVYCGVAHTAICAYLNGKAKPKEDTRKQLEKGVKELITEIFNEGRWLYNRRI